MNATTKKNRYLYFAKGKFAGYFSAVNDAQAALVFARRLSKQGELDCYYPATEKFVIVECLRNIQYDIANDIYYYLFSYHPLQGDNPNRMFYSKYNIFAANDGEADTFWTPKLGVSFYTLLKEYTIAVERFKKDYHCYTDLDLYKKLAKSGSLMKLKIKRD